MEFFITESKTKTTTEVEKEITLDIDISKLEEEQQSELLTELLAHMSDEDIEDCVDSNDTMIRVILKNHVYIKDKDIQRMVWILEGDVEHVELKKDLMLLIEKYNLQGEL